jgi:hypothetical protein
MSRRLAVTVAVVAALLAGCASLPTSSAVRRGQDVVAAAQDEPFIRVLARPPVAGMTQRQVLTGFLAASAAFDANHAVARQFLTPSAAESWDPGAGTVVYDASAASVLEDSAADLRLRAPEVARISGRFEYAASGAETTAEARYRLVQVAGQWRIDALPTGLYLSTIDVRRAFRSFSLYFLDATGTRLVPDRIVVPAALPGLSTTLVRALLTGPSPWLEPAVQTAAPPGTALAAAGAPITDGVVTVDLTEEVLAADAESRRRLSAQVVWTLRQLPEVVGVRLLAAGSAFPVPGAQPVQGRDSWPSFDPDGLAADAVGYVVSDGRLLSIGDETAAVAGPFGDGRLVPVAPAISLDSTSVASLADGGRGLLAGTFADVAPSPLLTGTSLTAPTWDPADGVWTVDRTASESRIWRVVPGSAPQAVDVVGFGDRRVIAFRLARDGTRAAVVLDEGGVGRLYLARVERFGEVPRVAQLRRVESALVDVRDVVWRDSVRLAVLATDVRGTVEPFLIDADSNAVSASGSLDGVRGLAAAPGRPLLAVTADGSLWADRGFGWRAEGTGTAVAYPG